MMSPATVNSGFLRAEVRKLVSDVLGRPLEETENPSRDTESGWDSFTHVELVFLLEDHFQITFDGTEIARLHDVREIVRALETLLAKETRPGKPTCDIT